MNEREQLIARLRRFAVVLEARGETYDAETCEQAIAALSAPPAGYVLVTREALACTRMALRAPLDGWKGELERKALDLLRDVTAAPAAPAQEAT